MTTRVRLFAAVLLSLCCGLHSGHGAAAEIYTFGKGANGSRFVKHVDRPVANRKAEAKAREAGVAAGVAAGGSAEATKGRQAGGAGRTQGPPPPPPVDSKALEVLNSPIM
jgi:hypothetical protein